ncbi:hypothetical protein M5K25_003742 [Dendrobium thyrsiflorum]|uniref:FAR1 domain-containing protein n=1 Tax=Dendrobium thyrsiflorum TaxID=117978 RepID=A0ABD0VSA7_DENTH
MKCSEEISPNIEIEERMKCSEEIDIEDRGNDFQKSEVRFTGTAEGFNISGILVVCLIIQSTFLLYKSFTALSLSFHCAFTAVSLRSHSAFTVAYKDEKEAYEAYCSYAHNNGFSVRKDHHSFWPNSKKIKTKNFVCSKAGFKKQSDLNSQKKCRRSETRTGCPCLIRFSVDEDGNWIIRSKWSTAFNKEYFSMGILSTQRSESTNNVCHGISKPTSFITECFIGLEKIITNWRRNEQDEDHKCSQSEIVPVIRSSSILKQAARFYSRKLYSFFEEEFLQGKGSDSGSGFIFRNHISRFAYQISTRAQGNELAEQYMLGAMKDMAENIDLLVEGKMTNSNFISKSKSRAAPVSAFKDPQKRRPKGISNARLKGYWEKKKQKSTF